MSDETDLNGLVENLAVRVDKLEAQREQVLKPKINRQEETIADLEQRLEQLEGENHELRAEVDSLGELGADKDSTPKKRVLDLRKLLINKAKADHESGGDGMVAWKYSQVVDALESNGHGKVYAAQAYDAMEDAADADGFGFGKNDNDEKTVRVNWEALPAYTDVNDINNGEGVPGTDQPTMSD